VRALRHACERAVILGQGAEYSVADFGLPSLAQATTPAAAASAVHAVADSVVVPALAEAPASAPSGDTTLDAIERAAIAATLAQFNGNISHAAKTLGISRAALYRKLGKHGI
jgi:DNA-binding NtrC family response regulator